MLDLEIVLHICLIRISLPYLWLTIAIILLLLRYETSKLDDLKTTQINVHFLVGQDFEGFLPNLIVELNGGS
jgi:hypothetical protein